MKSSASTPIARTAIKLQKSSNSSSGANGENIEAEKQNTVLRISVNKEN
jgi:hypothetical protein